MEFVALAHEEGVSTGPEAWLGPALMLGIIFLSIVIGKVVRRQNG